MFDKLKQLKELKKMRDEAMVIQKSMDAETVEVEKRDVKVKITLAQRVVSIESGGKDDDIVEAVNEAVKQSQKEAARKMQQMGGFDSLKGMMGGGS